MVSSCDKNSSIEYKALERRYFLKADLKINSSVWSFNVFQEEYVTPF
jgi:hypothetical protein